MGTSSPVHAVTSNSCQAPDNFCGVVIEAGWMKVTIRMYPIWGEQDEEQLGNGGRVVVLLLYIHF